MGYGTFSESSYNSSRAVRSSSGISDFHHSETTRRVHESLDPKRISKKGFGLLESRDSVEHPISTPVILTFDVTGSNINNARTAQQKLPLLMAQLEAVCENPQIAIWANDDVFSMGEQAIQMGEFESDNRIDDTIRNVYLSGRGGSNAGESYDLLVYAAARKVITDSLVKRNQKGYMFLYADEPFFDAVTRDAVQTVFGDDLQADIPMANIIAEAKSKWDIFVIWPMTGFHNARTQYVQLFGEECVETLQDPAMLCEKVASIIARCEATRQPTVASVTEDSHFVDRVV